MKLKRALHAIVAVRMDEAPDSIGGIDLPVFAREEVEIGTVVTAGPGEYDDKGVFTENPVKDGDRVIIAKGSGVTMKVGGEELLFLTPNEITGIIRD